MQAKDVLLKIKDFILKFRLELIILVAAIVLDQVSKAVVYSNMVEGQSVTLIPKFLHVTYMVNTGAAFSFLEGQTWLFILTASLATVGFSIFLFWKQRNSKLFTVSMGMIIGGTVGNLIDRIFNHGGVHDFIEFEYFGLTIFNSRTFAIFNIADACLVIGVILFAVYFIFFYKEPEKKKAVPADDGIVEETTGQGEQEQPAGLTPEQDKIPKNQDGEQPNPAPDDVHDESADE